LAKTHRLGPACKHTWVSEIWRLLLASAFGRNKEHTFLNPFPKYKFAAPKHHLCAAEVLESGRIRANLGKSIFFSKMVRNVARMANGVHIAPKPFIFPPRLRREHTSFIVGAGSGAMMGVKKQIGNV